MPTKEPSRCGQVMPGGQPVVCECESTVPGSASGRAFSPTQGLRFFSSRLAMRAVRRHRRPHLPRTLRHPHATPAHPTWWRLGHFTCSVAAKQSNSTTQPRSSTYPGRLAPFAPKPLQPSGDLVLGGVARVGRFVVKSFHPPRLVDTVGRPVPVSSGRVENPLRSPPPP